ncbi:MAG TPA: ABC transporter substrate-binding protein, partial [Pseudolabrys sp.]|nr:ABC transporter substrate-binding protein [Pseudolabrys sp.]
KSDAGFFFMAAKRGFDQKEGIKIEIKQVKDDQIGLKALIAGELDSFEGGPQGAISADAKGADARILGCHWVVVPHGIYVRGNIHSVKDLKGKSIAVSAPNSMPDMLARAALEKYGVDPSQVKLAAVGGDRERYQALVGGVVQAAVVSNEYEPVAPKDVHLLVAGRDALPKLLRVCIMSSAKVLAARSDDAVHFLTAEMKALRYAVSNKDATVALTREMTHAKPDDPRPGFVWDDAVKHHAVDPTLPIPMDKLEWLQQQLVKVGKLSKTIDLKTVVAPEYREKALAAAGK